MAGYQTHLRVSTLLGIGYSAVAYTVVGCGPAASILGGLLTSLGGILPDLDSDTGKPIREIFGFLGALMPVLMVRRLSVWLAGFEPEATVLAFVLFYLLVRFGGTRLINKFAVHRGMFHSIPAMIIAGEVTFLVLAECSLPVRVSVAIGVMAGFFSHLLLDEVYAVQWSGIRLKLNKYAGSAIKFTGKSFPANVVTYGLLAAMTYVSLYEAGLVEKKSSSIDNVPQIATPMLPGPNEEMLR